MLVRVARAEGRVMEVRRFVAGRWRFYVPCAHPGCEALIERRKGRSVCNAHSLRGSHHRRPPIARCAECGARITPGHERCVPCENRGRERVVRPAPRCADCGGPVSERGVVRCRRCWRKARAWKAAPRPELGHPWRRNR